MEPPEALFVIGATKAGTTALHHYLGHHPDLRMSTPKETQFFDLHYEKGLDFFLSRFFPGWQPGQAIGESTCYNLWLSFIGERIQALFPRARLVAVLRNPVERAFSDWWMASTNGREPLSFEAAISANLESLSRPLPYEGAQAARRWAQDAATGHNLVPHHRDYLDSGYYAQKLQPFLERYGSERVLVLRYEALSRDPLGTTRQIWQFAGLTGSPLAIDCRPHNVGLGRLSGALNRLAEKSQVKRILPRGVALWTRAALERLGDPRPAMAPATREFLVRHYEPHNRALEQLLGWNLAPWISPAPS